MTSLSAHAASRSILRTGQVTADLVMVIVFVTAALVFMVPYLQRAAQGNLFGATEFLGLPFDPRDGYTETQRIVNMNETINQKVEWSMVPADLLPVGPVLPGVDSSQGPHPDWVLSSLPDGPVPREPAFQQSKVDASWTTTRSSTYDDLR